MSVLEQQTLVLDPFKHMLSIVKASVPFAKHCGFNLSEKNI